LAICQDTLRGFFEKTPFFLSSVRERLAFCRTAKAQHALAVDIFYLIIQ